MSGKSYPTHVISLQHRLTKRAAQVGFAYQNPNGSFSLYLTPGAVLTFDEKQEYHLRLFPNDRRLPVDCPIPDEEGSG